jgi:hypothetical protein
MAAREPRLSKSTKKALSALFAAPTSTRVLVPAAAAGSTCASARHLLATPGTFEKFTCSLWALPKESNTSKLVCQVPS